MGLRDEGRRGGVWGGSDRGWSILPDRLREAGKQSARHSESLAIFPKYSVSSLLLAGCVGCAALDFAKA